MIPNDQEHIQNEDYFPIVKQILEIEGNAVLNQAHYINESINEAINLILNCKGKVVITGIGKSGIFARKICATLASTGTSSIFLHPAEGLHGDLGMVEEDDIVPMPSFKFFISGFLIKGTQRAEHLPLFL
ncbi:SIS domain-containing protein [Halalkalibacter kiskunsagensis]|uniref:SIS domain-containing protein n=1 Tax=Halalkalibacter kiskunsagensis TaxID=1548599 RepID=A0ABV6K803_9BACI